MQQCNQARCPFACKCDLVQAFFATDLEQVLSFFLSHELHCMCTQNLWLRQLTALCLDARLRIPFKLFLPSFPSPLSFPPSSTSFTSSFVFPFSFCFLYCRVKRGSHISSPNLWMKHSFTKLGYFSKQNSQKKGCRHDTVSLGASDRNPAKEDDLLPWSMICGGL